MNVEPHEFDERALRNLRAARDLQSSRAFALLSNASRQQELDPEHFRERRFKARYNPWPLVVFLVLFLLVFGSLTAFGQGVPYLACDAGAVCAQRATERWEGCLARPSSASGLLPAMLECDARLFEDLDGCAAAPPEECLGSRAIHLPHAWRLARYPGFDAQDPVHLLALERAREMDMRETFEQIKGMEEAQWTSE